MKVWWHNLTLHDKLQIPIQFVLLLVLIPAQVWVMREFERDLFENAERRAVGSATQSFLGLNAMMLNGSIRQPQARMTYFKKMAGQDGVVEFHLVRGKPVQDQYGAGLPEEQARDELDRNALASNRVQMQRLTQDKPALRVVVPFAARTDFHGTDCLQCHHVPEGAVNGAVSLTISLDQEYAELERMRTRLNVGQMALQMALFFLIGTLVRRTVAELEKYHERAEEDQRVGGFIMARITEMPELPDVQRYMRPVEHLSGDILIAAEGPDGAVHVLLADATGHGLSAAVNVLPLCQTFYDLTEKGFSLGEIANELNRLVNKLMPADRFVSAALASIHHPSRIIEIWNGGIPPLVLLDRTGHVIRRWTSDNLPLGILSDENFSAKTEAFQYREDCQLCLFSDGLVEAATPHGIAFGETRLFELLGEAAYENRLHALVAGVEKHLQGASAHDDISLAIINIAHKSELESGPEKLTRQIVPGNHAQTGSAWRIAISLGAAELKYLDVVPLVTQIIAKINVTREHHSALFMILSELFNNALDHGLLQLDSALKLEPDGFDQYLESRDARLRALQNGKIDIEIATLEIADKPAVQIRVADSGGGFDHAAFGNAAADRPLEVPYGRGIALVKSVACKLEYSGRGNEVVASYICA
ncbi:MAG: hypothetical protein EPO42_05360 [Gallionellaceae bacterium]|nr:MAG: hypothetical protein EPO42_05360 [Gallionellaceae bacterium]